MNTLNPEEWEVFLQEFNQIVMKSILNPEEWEVFLQEFNGKVTKKANLEEFKEEVWDVMMEYGGPVFIETGLDQVAREVLSKK